MKSLKKLSELLIKVGSGVTPKGGRESYQTSGIPLIRSQNVLWGRLSLDDVAFIDEKQHSKMKGSSVLAKDVLLNITGASIGRACVVPDSITEANVNQHVCILRPSKNITSEFLLINLLSDNGQKQINLFQAGGNRQGLNFEQIKSIKVNLPPLPEQRKIASILGTWDTALEKLDALISAKERQKRALMQQLLTGKTRLKGFSGKWCKVRFGDLMRPEDRYEEFNDDKEYKLVSVRRRAEGVFFREALMGRDIKTKVMKRVQENDFIISRMQVVHGALGRVPKECDGYYASDSYEVLIPKDTSKIDIKFLEQISKTKAFWNKTYVCSHGVHIEKMTFKLSDFMKEKFLIPSLPEQTAIAKILETADRELSLLRKQRTALDQQKRGLMQELLTGKRRVKV